MAAPRFIKIDPSAEAALVEAARDGRPVQGLTHNHYRYPARFSAVFARATIDAFTREGDLVLDPHMGGGTTLVEAAASGRDAIGVDVSSLAEFVASVKTTVFEDDELAILSRWAADVVRIVEDGGDDGSRPPPCDAYRRHLDHPQRSQIERAAAIGIGAADALPRRLRDFGRCVMLRSAQAALDGRRKTLEHAEFISLLARNGGQMVEMSKAYKRAVEAHATRPTVQTLQRSSAGLEADGRMAGARAPRLVLTSPPYPGVHILYHRWQVGGGRETAAPFWIAGRLDGEGSSFYTMGDRRERDLSTYFSTIRASLASIAALCDRDTVIVQMLAFADPAVLLPRYIAAMDGAGLRELFLPSLRGGEDGRLWRDVPNRRWYSQKRGGTPASREVVLFHVLKPGSYPPAPSARAPASRCDTVHLRDPIPRTGTNTDALIP